MLCCIISWYACRMESTMQIWYLLLFSISLTLWQCGGGKNHLLWFFVVFNASHCTLLYHFLAYVLFLVFVVSRFCVVTVCISLYFYYCVTMKLGSRSLEVHWTLIHQYLTMLRHINDLLPEQKPLLCRRDAVWVQRIGMKLLMALAYHSSIRLS